MLTKEGSHAADLNVVEDEADGADEPSISDAKQITQLEPEGEQVSDERRDLKPLSAASKNGSN
jgi:hypothetical protein